ncbi:MAG: hypothetical protein FWE63_07760 [Bacteroidales bacterium]|nr:hypothetical protein [Bacteroidales bacterium]
MNKELVFLRTFAVAMAIGMTFVISTAMKNSGNQKFTEIDVERINIVEKDGTVKMIITNVDRFPTGQDVINGIPSHDFRPKMAGMLFFNNDGMECGGLVFAGLKAENGHEQGLSFTYDQYDGDQVMQILTQDYQQGDQRMVRSTLVFNDRKPTESMSTVLKQNWEGLSPEEMESKFGELAEQGLIGGAVPRIMLGKSQSLNDGLFLYDDKGKPRAMFYVDKENNAKLDFLDEKGNVIASFPEKKK